MNPMPISSIERATRSGGRSIFAPSASSTSADPQRELTERLPCFATRTPAPAITNEAAVEILNVPAASPPVPAVSTRTSFFAARPAGKIGVAWRRIAVAKPTTSSTVSPFMRSAVSKPAISASLARPARISSIAASASARVKSSSAMIFSRASRIMRLRGRHTALHRYVFAGWFHFESHTAPCSSSTFQVNLVAFASIKY